MDHDSDEKILVTNREMAGATHFIVLQFVCTVFIPLVFVDPSSAAGFVGQGTSNPETSVPMFKFTI